MYTVLAYFVSLIAIAISVAATLFIKSELERMFREDKDELAFHICNVIIVLMVAMVVQTVTTVYAFGNEFNWLLQLIILTVITIPVYYLGHLVFEKYQTVYRKYSPTENRKVIVLNDKYVKKVKPFSKLKHYNASAKEMEKENKKRGFR